MLYFEIWFYQTQRPARNVINMDNKIESITQTPQTAIKAIQKIQNKNKSEYQHQQHKANLFENTTALNKQSLHYYTYNVQENHQQLLLIYGNMNKFVYEAYRYAIVVCRNNQGKFLCVKETQNRGWWLPGGKVQLGETFLSAAIREIQQQTLIVPKIKGIIRIDYGKYYVQNCLRCIYYAQPADETHKPKNKADQQSQRAQFLSIEQIIKMKKDWRGPEIYEFPKYIHDGKPVYPLQIFAENFNEQELKL